MRREVPLSNHLSAARSGSGVSKGRTTAHGPRWCPWIAGPEQTARSVGHALGVALKHTACVLGGAYPRVSG